jgi:MOSC domain-containing protein YiiM
MQVVSVNVGLPREIQWKNATVQTAIFKEPVQGQVSVGKLNLAGDRQADLKVHGGADKAVYAYPSEHYAYWQNELAVALSQGNFGENLTTQGLSEDALFIGDRLRIGSAVLRVTQPRMPCYKLGIRFDRDDMIKRFLASRRCGFYFSVEQEGDLSAEAKIEFLSRDRERVSVIDIVDLYVGEARDPELLERVMRVAGLPSAWQSFLGARANSRLVD